MKISVPSIIIGLVIGLIAGYYWGKSKSDIKPHTGSSSSSFTKAPDNAFTLVDPNDTSAGPGISRHIGDSLAYVLIKDFQAKNESSPNPLMTEKGPLKGYFIEREPIEAILKDTHNWDGISVYLATASKNEMNTNNRRYTMIYMGAKYKAGYGPHDATIQVTNMTDAQLTKRSTGVDDSLAYDFVKPCPTVCGDFDGHEPPPPTVAKASKKLK